MRFSMVDGGLSMEVTCYLLVVTSCIHAIMLAYLFSYLQKVIHDRCYVQCHRARTTPGISLHDTIAGVMAWKIHIHNANSISKDVYFTRKTRHSLRNLNKVVDA